MKYIGTRGGEKVSGAKAIMQGLSANGGLFVPEKFPCVSEKEFSDMLDMNYAERAAKIIGKLLDEFNEKELLSVCEEKYAADPAPLVRLDDGVYILELFHGPTCSFKDIAISLLPYMFKKAGELTGNNKEMLVLASSADAGKAALEAFKDSDGFKVAAIYPHDGISKMQKLHITTQEGKNVSVIALKGGHDDCLRAVKEILADDTLGVAPLSADSLNVAVIAAQVAYFFSAYADLVSSEQIAQGEEIDFTLPVGSFGSAISAYYAKRMGLPLRRIHCASNLNKTLADFFKTGVYDINRELYKTTAPSMDMIDAGGLERLIFEVSGRNYKLTAKRMAELKECGKYAVTDEEKSKIAEIFDGGFAGEEDSVEAMYDVFIDTGYTMDTHTGCAMKVAVDWFEKNKKDETKMVITATANPYKFPQDVLYAVTGNDVKDSFKGVKRLHAATAMAVPKCLKELRDKLPRFTKTVDRKKLNEEISNFIKQ